MTVFTAQWTLNGVPVLGPDQVAYEEVPTLALRLDGTPQRQGFAAMEWRYQLLPADLMAQFLTVYNDTYPSIAVRYLSPNGDWVDGQFHMLLPVIGQRSTVLYQNVVIRFVVVHYTGAGLATSQGAQPSLYGGFNVNNTPPTAAIAYSVSIWGDPQVVVALNGSGSHDADGVITSYAWTDNTSDFQSIPNYPQFDPPHEASTAQTQFVYEYMPGMPNPKVTLTVTDNAGLTGTKTVEVNIANLVAAQALSGRKFAVAGGAGYVSLDGGLSFLQADVSDFVSAVACPGGSIIWGTDTGKLLYAAQGAVETATEALQFPAGDDGSPALVTWIDVCPQNTRKVVACTNKGKVALSINGGLTWTYTTDPGMACVKVEWNIDTESELCVVGTDLVSAAGLCKISRDGGSTWQTDVVDLPYPSEARAVQRSQRLRYIGLQGVGAGSLFVATGAAWMGITMPASSDIQTLSMDKAGSGVFVGDAQGNAYKVAETTIERTMAVGAGGIRCILRDEIDPQIALIGAEAGLYKTLTDLQTTGVIGLTGTTITQVDWLRDPMPPEAELLIPTFGAYVDDDGLWHYSTLFPNDHWKRYPAGGASGMPEGWYWRGIRLNPLNPTQHWVMWGNTQSGNYFPLVHSASGNDTIVADGMQGPRTSPVWETKDGGTTWTPIPLSVLIDPSYNTAFTYAQLNDIVFDRADPGNLLVAATLGFSQGFGLYAGNGVVFRGTTQLIGTRLNDNRSPRGDAPHQNMQALDSSNTGDMVMWDNGGGLGVYGAGSTISYLSPGATQITVAPGPASSFDVGSLRVERTSNRVVFLYNGQIYGAGDYAATNYHPLVANTGGNRLVYTLAGVYTNGKGIRRYANPFGTGEFVQEIPEPTTNPEYVNLSALEMDDTGLAVACRLPYLDYHALRQTGLDTWVFDKKGWTLVLGPARPTLYNGGRGMFADVVGVIGR